MPNGNKEFCNNKTHFGFFVQSRQPIYDIGYELLAIKKWEEPKWQYFRLQYLPTFHKTDGGERNYISDYDILGTRQLARKHMNIDSMFICHHMSLKSTAVFYFALISLLYVMPRGNSTHVVFKDLFDRDHNPSHFTQDFKTIQAQYCISHGIFSLVSFCSAKNIPKES